MSVGELSRRTGVTTATVNYYVSLGILPRPRKTAQTRAVYTDRHVRLLGRIKELQAEGVPLRLMSRALAGWQPAAGPHGALDRGRVQALPEEPVSPEHLVSISGISEETYKRLVRSGVLKKPRVLGNLPNRHSRSDVSLARAVGRLLAAGVPFDLIEKHRAYQPLSQAEAHFLAENILAAGDANNPDLPSIISAFDAVRRYQRNAELDAAYRHWQRKGAG